MPRPRWRIKTLMVAVAVTAGLLALAVELSAEFLILAILCLPTVTFASLKPSMAVRLCRRAWLTLALLWVTDIATLLFVPLSQILWFFAAITGLCLWIALAFTLGCVVSVGVSLFRGKESDTDFWYPYPEYRPAPRVDAKTQRRTGRPQRLT